MKTDMEIEIPADAKTVTLEIEKHCSFTLRSLLPYIKDEVELVVIDEFGIGVNTDADLYRLKANSGNALLCKLARSRVVEGEAILDLVPEVKSVEGRPTLINGSFYLESGTSYVELRVHWPAPDEED